VNDPVTMPDGTLVIDVVDSHTGGEPTRVVVGGFPPLSGATLAERAVEVATSHRRLATAIVAEPRGNEAMVGALLTPPVESGCDTGVIFFDRRAVLGMCGHGTIGLVETLHRCGRLGRGQHRIETPAGVVPVVLEPGGDVTFDNVVSHRVAADVTLIVPSLGTVRGDVAYGGNVFFLVEEPAVDLDRPMPELLAVTAEVLAAAHAAGFADVDHVELYGPATRPGATSRNFVLCPSGTYDRSPCGTGTSAKVAALAARGALEPGQPWVQESITGSTFTVRYRWHDRAVGSIVPTVSGAAVVIGQARLFVAPGESGPAPG
jgi:4-hydroxyproline epimerase